VAEHPGKPQDGWADDVEATMLAARALVAISAQSVATVEEVVTPPQLRVLVMIASQGPLNLGPTDDLARLPLILLSTTNRPDLIDSAMSRRLGLHARFTRLDRAGFEAVLACKLKPHYPYAGPREEVLEGAVRWLFGPGGETQGLVEVTLGDGQVLVKRRRDFLTGGLVEQALATAIDRTVAEAAEEGSRVSGLTLPALLDGLRLGVDSLADQLGPDNAADYLDLPENSRVAGVRRLRSARATLPPSLDELQN